MKKLLFLLVTVSLLTAACSGGNQADSEPTTDTATAPTTEFADTSAEGASIALLSPEDGTIPMGDAELVLQVMNPATNEPIAVENLEVDLSMPMDGMEPMTTMVVVEPGEETGQYKVMTNLGMQGMWMMEVTSADPAMQGEATFELEVK